MFAIPGTGIDMRQRVMMTERPFSKLHIKNMKNCLKILNF